MLGRIFSIGTLFALTRRAAQESKIEELRANTEVSLREQRHLEESASQKQNLQRMRSNANAQTQMALAGSGVGPMVTMGGIQAAHIQQAAVNNAAGGRAGRLMGGGYGS